ncbi:peptidoglycan-binding domain-containing protein [Variovorax soli]|uniref:peptidoglycan-binding domain-containing protein n=1 Tax=Variovorax soli TaxID=376815 RepID=UPI0008384AFD|nr:peptidoglycan-binding domain-containing protein [Variovorax soli]
MSTAARNILASVGLGGSNLVNDVVTIQSMLNNVPTGNGGPAPKLEQDGKCGPLTVGAIRNFQWAQFKFADGRVDAGQRTLERLQSFDTGGAPAPAPPPGGGIVPQVVIPPGFVPTAPAPPPSGGGAVPIQAGLSPLRRRICELALADALPQPAVSDLITAMEDGTRVRAGWRRLKQYFDEGVKGWTENHWKDKATLDGVRIPGKRIPQGVGADGKPRGISWCGIFATWVVRSAGVETKWTSGVGPSGLKLRANRECKPGDICVMKGSEVHHFIPVSIDGDNMVTVNGNSDNQAVLVKTRPLSCLAYYYSVEG